jgi:hypothetical protein
LDVVWALVFGFLEQFSVSTPVRSISGPKGNRFAGASGTISSWLGNKGITIDMPNDLVVEDQSVDLHDSILRNGIIHRGREKYLYARGYMGCTDVWHSNI